MDSPTAQCHLNSLGKQQKFQHCFHLVAEVSGVPDKEEL